MFNASYFSCNPPLCGAFLGWAARAARSDAFWRWALFMSDRAQYAADRMRPRAVRVGVHNRPVGLSTNSESKLFKKLRHETRTGSLQTQLIN